MYIFMKTMYPPGYALGHVMYGCDHLYIHREREERERVITMTKTTCAINIFDSPLSQFISFTLYIYGQSR